MRAIYKYPIGNATTHEIPDGKFLCVQMQNQEPHVWFEVDPSAKPVPRRFHIVGTGHAFEGGTYLGTVQSPPFVWHVYEESGGRVNMQDQLLAALKDLANVCRDGQFPNGLNEKAAELLVKSYGLIAKAEGK